MTPPDPNGDVGPNHYVEMVNLAYAVYDKAGQPKKWVQYPITHYQIYTPEWVAPSAKVAAEFFTEHLKR